MFCNIIQDVHKFEYSHETNVTYYPEVLPPSQNMVS